MSPIDLILSARYYEAFLLAKRKKEEENKRRSAFYFAKSSGGVVVRAFASQQWSPGSIPRSAVLCGLTLLVLYSVPRGFAPSTPVFPST